MMTMMKASCYHENAQRQVHEQELRMIDVMMVSAQKTLLHSRLATAAA
jgi:hypothetical protein